MIDETQMPTSPEHAFKEKSTKLLILPSLRTIYNRTFQCETPCTSSYWSPPYLVISVHLYRGSCIRGFSDNFCGGQKSNQDCICMYYCQKVSTNPITAMGCWQCLSLSVVQLKGKHCRNPHCHNGVVDTFVHCKH